jgi:hypothetical protein
MATTTTTHPRHPLHVVALGARNDVLHRCCIPAALLGDQPTLW